MRPEAVSRLRGERVWSNEGGCVAVFFGACESDGRRPPVFGENSNAAWAVQGRLFERDGAPVCVEDIVRTALIDHEDVSRRYWGDYSIIVYDKRADRFLILSDPCGQRSVFYHRAADGAVHVGGTIDELIEPGRVPGEPDARYLSQFVTYGCGDPGSTGWRDISLLPPGQAVLWKRHQPLEFRRAWSPWNWTARRDGRDFIDVLTMVQRSCLDGDATIFLELSGGIDSTSLAVALRRADLHRRTVAVTHFDPLRASSNEVSIARAVADHCQIEHRTYPLLARLPFTPVERAPTVAIPATKLCFLAHANGLAESGVPGGDGLMLNGHGGDALYLAQPPFGVLVDAASSLRFRRVWRAARDLAIHYRVPLWTVLAQARSEASRYLGEPAVQPASQAVVPPGAPRPMTDLNGDIMRRLSLRLKPARRYQIAATSAIIDDALVQTAHARPVMPFLTQPIVEHALGMRIDEMFSADHSRLAVRRSVFAASGLPNLWRTDKGDIMHSALEGIKVNHAHVRETCVDGWCAANRLVEPDALARLIKRAALGFPDGLVEITRIYATEMFVRALKDSSDATRERPVSDARIGPGKAQSEADVSRGIQCPS
ncbi:hypothetical protein BZL54_10250 [Burkholderia ubonensis subsp. mesacidophila]|uniref:asparagine synthase (glutamine-hydrolyzing) n=2 Tax=Burkholderia ubonensis TaxID=101571 RepID=A0A2A4FIT6_9BURK|nr:hypothetical protein BZL54_10250 [Burkholderia ubonensis subsp. mesacidophila]